MKVTATNNLDVMTGDIVNAYLNVNTQENIYTCAGTEFELVVILSERGFLEVIKALNGHRCHSHLLHTLRSMDFKTNRFYQDVWIRGS